MPVNQDFNFVRQPLIAIGQHDFFIRDIEVQYKKNKQQEDIAYLSFFLTEKKLNQDYDNLLSIPMNIKNKSFTSQSKMYTILKKFGIETKEHEEIDSNKINDLIGNSFSGFVEKDERGFFRIVEETIQYQTQKTI